MPKRTDKVEIILPNGTTRRVSESLVEDMTKHFGAVLASDKSFRKPPKELLTALKKVVVPVLDTTEIPDKVEAAKIEVPAEYPEPLANTEAVVEKKVAIRKPRKK